MAFKYNLCFRVVALGENTKGEICKKSKKILESRIAALESGKSGASLKKGNKIGKYDYEGNIKKGQYNISDEV